MEATETDIRSRHPISESVRSRRSIRLFRDDPIPGDVVRELVRAAPWAPSPHNSQPWRFTALFGRADKERLADAMGERLTRDLRDDHLGEDEVARQTARSRLRITSAPVAILCSLVGDGLGSYPDRRRNELEWQMAVQSVGAVLQTLFLLAAARGLGTCWMAAPMYCPGEVRSALALAPELVPQALVLPGYPAHPGKVRPRRFLDEVLELR